MQCHTFPTSCLLLAEASVTAAAGAAGQGRGPPRHPLHQTLWREVRIQSMELVPSTQSPVPVPTILSSHTRFDPSQLPYFKYRQAMAQLAANSTQVRQVNTYHIHCLLFIMFMVIAILII